MAKVATGLALLFSLTSCASISVDEGTDRVTQKMPEIIYVLDFNTDKTVFNVDRKGEELADFKKDIQLTLKSAMIEDLNDRLVTAVPIDKLKKNHTKSAWLVSGEFTTVNQGSRLLRTVVGFSSGQTLVETHVEVYDLSSETGIPFLTFSTTGGSGAQPGEFVSAASTPLLIGLGVASHLTHGLDEDTARTAREITAMFSDYMYKQGWIREGDWIKPKLLNGNDTW